MEKSSKKILTIFKEYGLITLGLLLYTIGMQIFVFPNQLVGGGVSGISALLLYALKIPVSWSYFIINLALLAIGLKVLGKAFGFKTVYAIFIASLFYEILPRIDVINEFALEFSRESLPLICAMFGGLCAGGGIGISFTQGGSTGGTDIIALIVNKYRNISPGKIILLLDIIIIGSSFFINHDMSVSQRLLIVLYGYVLTFVVSNVADAILAGNKSSMQLFIFSKEYEKIADSVVAQIGRGVTIIDGIGWYTKTEGKVAMVIVRKTELSRTLAVIKRIDPKAFISVGDVMGVYGQGFDQIKK